MPHLFEYSSDPGNGNMGTGLFAHTPESMREDLHASTASMSSKRESRRVACTKGTDFLAATRSLTSSSVEAGHLFPRRLLPRSDMLSTPASIDTHPAAPRSTSISGFHRSILVCTANVRFLDARASRSNLSGMNISSMK